MAVMVYALPAVARLKEPVLTSKQHVQTGGIGPTIGMLIILIIPPAINHVLIQSPIDMELITLISNDTENIFF